MSQVEFYLQKIKPVKKDISFGHKIYIRKNIVVQNRPLPLTERDFVSLVPPTAKKVQRNKQQV
jgi:hypothetical protein